MWEGKEFPFLQGFTEYAEHCVAEADRAAFLEFIDPGRIRAGLENEAMISHRYRSIRSGEERYEMLRIAGVRLIEERDDHMRSGGGLIPRGRGQRRQDGLPELHEPRYAHPHERHHWSGQHCAP